MVFDVAMCAAHMPHNASCTLLRPCNHACGLRRSRSDLRKI